LNSFVMTRYIFHLTGLFGMLSCSCSNSALYHMRSLLCAVCSFNPEAANRRLIIRVFDTSLLG
jgi:hypothetical protein